MIQTLDKLVQVNSKWISISSLVALGLFCSATHFFLEAHAGSTDSKNSVILDTAALARATYPIDIPLGGPESIYTNVLLKLIHQWPPKGWAKLEVKDKNPVQLKCLETPGNPDYIGVLQSMNISASMQRVEAVLDNVNQYSEIFSGFQDIHVISQDGNQFLTFWEQNIPLFLIPNIKYKIQYIVNKTNPDKKIYRYKLKEVSQIKESDGLIVLERVSNEITRYFELDFYDADWGMLKTIAPGRIWRGSVESIYLSDISIKLRSENSEWSTKKVVEESQKILDHYPVEAVISNKVRMIRE